MVAIEDDGRGFAPTAVPESHLGVAGMRSPAEALGGRLAVRSAPGQGTTVEIVLQVTVGSPGVVAGP